MSNNQFVDIFENKVNQSRAIFKNLMPDKSSSNPIVSKELCNENNKNVITEIQLKENEFVEKIFRITLNQNKKMDIKPHIFLKNLQSNINQTWIDKNCLSQAVFERLLIPREELSSIISAYTVKNIPASNNNQSKQIDILPYLFECFVRLFEEMPELLNYEDCGNDDHTNINTNNLDRSFINFGSHIKKTIITNAATALQSPDLYLQNLNQQFIDVFLEYSTSSKRNHLISFYLLIFKYIEENDGYSTLYETSKAIFENLYKMFSESLTLISSHLFTYIDLMALFTQTSSLAQALLDYSNPLFENKNTKVPLCLDHAINNTLPSVSTETSTTSAFRRALSLGLNSLNSNLNSPDPISNGKAFEKTLLGAPLAISCLPKNYNDSMLFFNNVANLSRQEHKNMEQNLWKPLSVLVEKMYNIFYKLLKLGPDIKHLTLLWIGNCLHANAGRAKLWSTQVPETYAALYASDPFMLNLGAILLRLSIPFSFPNSERMLKVDMTYIKCNATTDDIIKEYGMHSIGLNNETCLVSYDEADDKTKESTLPLNPYNFVTECLFFTEQCLNLGFRIVLSKFLKLNQELGRLQVYYESLLSANSGNDEFSPAMQNIKDVMEKGLSQFLCMKAALLEPHFLEGAFNLSVAVCQFICNKLKNGSSVLPDNSSLITSCFVEPTELIFFSSNDMAFNNTTNNTNNASSNLQSDPTNSSTRRRILSYIPEYFVENLVDIMSLLSHFSNESLEYYGSFALEQILVFVLSVMGSPDRVKNPHLRAKLAETLEALLPTDAKRESDDGDDDQNYLNPKSFLGNKNWNTAFDVETSCRAQLFKGVEITGLAPYTTRGPNEDLISHPSYREYMIPVLIHVFVSIEETGHNVAFEQKFSYRRPMYVILKYLWKDPYHRAVVHRMTADAEMNIEAINPPLFLRFINLLINDAIFLLDEGLSFMSQLREILIKKEAGEWNKLTPQQRNENESNLQHLGLMARYHNMLGLETIKSLDYITRYTQTLFTHPTMVNRISSMLNYFLLHLVGPKKKNFKVKDLSAFEFKPQKIVTTICQIYVNLGNSASSRNDGHNEQPDPNIIPISKILQESEKSFCSGVSQDGRSYSPQLFTQAVEVLHKIAHKAPSSSFNTQSNFQKSNNLITQLLLVSLKVQESALKQEKEDELMADAPDEFLDPIMSTIMINPVKLPTSGKILDRATIARHLLSDQTDPFNRRPLNLEMVIPDDPLRQRIQEWMASKRSGE